MECKICKKEFIPKNDKIIFCSNACHITYIKSKDFLNEINEKLYSKNKNEKGNNI